MPSLESLPLVGRSDELAMLRTLLDRAEQGKSGILFLSGDGGIGKTRLVHSMREEARRRDWGHALGRANPVETGVPYALFADALLPALTELDQDVRTALTRGAVDELSWLFPTLATDATRRHAPSSGELGEFKSRVHWNFTEMVRRYTARAPLVVALEDLHWADASSLELLHFLARQIGDARLVIIGTFKPAEMQSNPTLRTTIPSLSGLGVASVHTLGPISATATERLVHTVFATEAAVARSFATQLHRWTGGNPFFIQETLKSLVAAGRLYQVGDQWMGWEVEHFELPGSIRDAVLESVRPLGAEAYEVARMAAVLGTRVRLDTLTAVSELSDRGLVAALDELTARHILAEDESSDAIAYDFTHALIQETLYAELGRARIRLMHGTVAERLEQHYGKHADQHVDELAFHFSRARGAALDRKAVRYLTLAGRNALAKYANDEAATYLSTAVERLEADDTAGPNDVAALLEDLARARQRMGDYEGATALWERVLRTAEAEQDWRTVGATERRMGLARFWTGHPADALRHYDAGLAASRRADDRPTQARISMAKGMCLHQLGQPAEAKTCVEEALELVKGGAPDLVARVHRALLLLNVWTGPSGTAREHGEQAIRLAEESRDRTLAFSAHWGMGVLEGLTGNASGLARQIERMRAIVDEAGSPVLRAWLAELEIEYTAARGEWEDAITIGERSIALARALNQTILLPRLLVWTALVYLARNELDRARAYIDEAWTRSGADAVGDRPPNLHIVIPAHIGRAALHLAECEYSDAIRVGQAGLAIADRHGYVVWTIHRLVPIVAESLIWMDDLDAARRQGRRLRDDSRRQGHKLGLAWADACDALVAWLDGDIARGAVLLESAAEKLDAIPFVYDAARVRRQLAGRLRELGDRDGALRELQRVHKVFAELGAVVELDKTRKQFRELEVRPPPRPAPAGEVGLTGRELQIARLVRRRYSNRRIASEIGRAERTVSTHLSNIYKKLSIKGRGELADWIRTHDVE